MSGSSAGSIGLACWSVQLGPAQECVQERESFAGKLVLLQDFRSSLTAAGDRQLVLVAIGPCGWDGRGVPVKCVDGHLGLGGGVGRKLVGVDGRPHHDAGETATAN